MYRLGLSLGLTTGSAFPPFDPLSLSPILAFDAQKSMLASGGGAAGNLDLVATLDNQVTGGPDATQTTAANQPRAHVPVNGGHLYLPAVTGNVPVCDAGSMTDPSDFLDLRVITADTRGDMTANNGRFVSKDNGGSNRLFYFMVKSDNKLFFPFWDTGGTLRLVTSTVVTAADTNGYRVVFRSVDTEDSSKLSVTFYTSTDRGQTWSQLGDKYTASGNHTLKQSSATDYFICGVNNSSSTHLINPLLKQIEIYLGDNETSQILDVDFAKAPHGAASFTPDAGGLVTINTSGNNPATIVRRSFLRFDGASSSGDYMQGSLASSIDTVHCIIQYRSNHTTYNTSTAGVFSVYASEDYQSTGVRVLSGYSNNSARSYYNSGHQLIQNSGFSPDNGTVVVEASFTDGAQFRKQNNAFLITDSASLSLNSNKFILGDLSQTGLGYASAIDVEQIYLFDRVLSEDEATKMRNHTNPKNSIYRRITDSDALAYIATLEGDGVSVSETQKEAIEDFYVTAKSDGWYSSLRRFYLPIWGAAAPNARCLVSGTSATFIGSFTHGSGFTHPSSASTSNRFNLNYTLSDEDLTTENACLMALAYDDTAPQDRGIPTSNHTLIGAGAVTSRSIRINTKSTGLRPQAAWLGVDEDNGNMGSHGVMLANRKDGDTTLTRRNASGISDTSTTGSLTGTWNDYPIMGFGSSTGAGGGITQQTDAKAGAFGIGAGLSSTNRSSYTDAVKTLWETCSGITL